MRKLILLLMIFSFQQTSAQETETVDTSDYQQLKKAAWQQRTGGIVCNVIGGGFIIWGVATLLDGSLNFDIDFFATEEEIAARKRREKEAETKGLILIGVGAVAELISIPFYVKAHKYSKLAKLKFRSGNVFIPGRRSVPQLQLRLTIPLGS